MPAKLGFPGEAGATGGAARGLEGGGETDAALGVRAGDILDHKIKDACDQENQRRTEEKTEFISSPADHPAHAGGTEHHAQIGRAHV